MDFKQFLILHSENDGASRFFVAGNYDPESSTVEVIEWSDETKRAEYEAAGLPSPSAFPSVVDTTTGNIVRIPKSLDDAIAVLTGQPTIAERLAAVEAALLELSLGGL